METIKKQFEINNNNFNYLVSITEKIEPRLDDEYMRINNTYYNVFCTHYESFLILLHYNHMSSAVLLMRTLLELTVKSSYVHFIEKSKGTSITEILNKNYTFFKMVEELENYKDISGAEFDGFFYQFTKSELATYENLSLFSHAKGEYIKAFYEHNKMSFTEEQTLKIISMANKFFVTNTMLYLFSQDEFEILESLIKKHKTTPFFYDNE